MPLRGTEAPGIIIQGFSAAIKAMDNIGGKPLRKTMQVANKKSAEPVRDEAKMLAPVRTGALRESIRLSSTFRKVQILSGNRKVPYSNPIHWGWFYDRNNFWYRNIKPNPFLSRALNLKREEVKRVYLENVDKLLKNEAERQRLKAKVMD